MIQTYSNHLQQMAGVKRVDSSIHLIFAIQSLGMPDVSAVLCCKVQGDLESPVIQDLPLAGVDSKEYFYRKALILVNLTSMFPCVSCIQVFI